MEVEKTTKQWNLEVIDKTWDLLRRTVANQKETDSNILFKESAYHRYKTIFMQQERIIRKKYMKKDVKHLDRHKTSGIIMYAILMSSCLKYKKRLEKGKLWFEKYLIAGNVGMDYMLDRLNAKLKKDDSQKRRIEKIELPEVVFSCDVPYFEVFCRNLYYASKNKNWGINPLDIAEKLYLLEYFTVEKQGIDPNILKENRENNHDS